MIVDKNTLFIAHNGNDIFHYGFVEKGTSFDSGQPIIEKFYSLTSWLNKLKKYNQEVSEEEIQEYSTYELIIDTTPPQPSNKGVIIPKELHIIFPEDKFILEGFEIPLQNINGEKVLDLAYFNWQAFRDCLNNGKHEDLKRNLMGVWVYVETQIELKNTIDIK